MVKKKVLVTLKRVPSFITHLVPYFCDKKGGRYVRPKRTTSLE